MFEIYAASANDHPDVIARIQSPACVPRGPARDDGPFLQVGYDEMTPEDLEYVFGYAAIAQTNGPVGVPALPEVVAHGTDWVLFPISGLRRHLSSVQRDRQSATTLEFAEEVDQVADYCERHDLLMFFRW